MGGIRGGGGAWEKSEVGMGAVKGGDGGWGMGGVRSGDGGWEGWVGVVGCLSYALPKCLLARLGSGSLRSEWCWSVGLLTRALVHESSLELRYGA